MVEYAGVRRNVMTTLSLTFVMLAMMTTAALGYTIDGDLSDWGVDLAGDWSVNETWVPNEGVKFIVENNENGCGVHIMGKGSNYAAYNEPQIQLSTGTWTNEPFMGEGYDLEAMYIDEDSNSIYIALVTSVQSGDPQVGDLALNLDGDVGTGGYGYEYGIRLNTISSAFQQWHIYRTPRNDNWSVPNTVPMNKPNILNANNPGAENGTIEGIYFRNSTYPPDDYSEPNWVIEMAIPKDNVGMAGKNLQEVPLPKVIYHTNLCGNDKVVWDMGTYAAIGDYVWEDTNRNGIQDTGEPGIEGVTVNLYTCAGTYVNSTTTNASGYYLFDNLVPGEYYVEFVAPAGYSFTLPDEGTDDAIDSDANVTTGRTDCTTLEPGEKDLTWDAGLYKLAAIGDYVWEDTNRNGTQDAGEPGIEGVTVNLYTCAGTHVATTTTNVSGYYLFDNLVPGEYYVEFVAPAGYSFTLLDEGTDDAIDSDANVTTGRTDCTTLEPGEKDLTWDAGLYELAAIGDYVWEDTNRNGIQDTGEPGIEGVTVNLYTCAGTHVATTTTNVSGYYLFDNLVPGEYYVEFVAPAGYSFTLLDQGTDDAIDSDANETTGKTICTTLESGEEDLTWDAGLYTPACTLNVQKFCSVIPPTAPFVCSDAKPIDSLTMIWNGNKSISNISVYRDKYDNDDPEKNRMYIIEGPIRNGDTVTAAGYAAVDARNDVDWLITFEDETTGISRFHRSCSDEDMNGPEDCGKYEGNAKSTDADFINLWLFEGMAGNGLTLDCTPEEPELNEECTVCAPTPGSCDDDKPTALVFEYTGDACSATTNFQDGKFKCEPADVPLGALADVVMTKDADTISVEIDGNTVKIFRSDTVGKEFPSEIKYVINDTDGNAQSQTLHTSCSKPLNVGDQFGSLILRDFVPKGGSVPEANVIYTYRINNTGTEDVTVDVVDNLLGDIANNLLIMGGELVELTEEVVLTEIGDITNTVTVTDTTDPDCFATDEVTVQVLPPPPPPFECDGKIVELTMIWDGNKSIHNISVYRDKYDSNDPEKNLMYIIEGPISNGDTVTAAGYAAADARNDVDWLITFEDGTTGISRFHRSCSDEDMNGPEDCGKPQGDGKNNEEKYINDWLLVGLVDGTGGVLDCTA